MSIDSIAEMTSIDRWFLKNIEQLVTLEGKLRAFNLRRSPPS